MTAISISVTNSLANESKRAACKLGISRAEFIRQAIKIALKHFRFQQKQDDLIKCFQAMKENAAYLRETNELLEDVTDELPEERDRWWEG